MDKLAPLMYPVTLVKLVQVVHLDPIWLEVNAYLVMQDPIVKLVQRQISKVALFVKKVLI